MRQKNNRLNRRHRKFKENHINKLGKKRKVKEKKRILIVIKILRPKSECTS